MSTTTTWRAMIQPRDHSGEPLADWGRISADMEAEEVSPGLFTVKARGRAIGDVLSDGPTVSTRFKAISPGQASVSPDSAPGSYHESLREAAESLAARYMRLPEY